MNAKLAITIIIGFLIQLPLPVYAILDSQKSHLNAKLAQFPCKAVSVV